MLTLGFIAGYAFANSGKTNKPEQVKVRFLDENGELTGITTVAKVVKTDTEWQKLLTAEQYRITRKKSTEPAFCGNLYDNKKQGIYSCVCCSLPLFSSNSKFVSGTGWPSFFAPIAEENITTQADLSHDMRGTEILCTRCDAHLGHVFKDGPQPTGLRYCVNSASLVFSENRALADTTSRIKATFGAGCFWGVEAALRKVTGVLSTAVGFMGGTTKNPTYEEVCRGNTGHAEVVQVIYDPAGVTYDELLSVFWDIHDPTTRNRQGPDIGSQYRSVIFFHNDEQEKAASASREELQKSGKFQKPIVTEIEPASEFYKAEEYHQQYLEKQGKNSCPGK